MSAPTTIRRGGYGTTTPSVRPPDPYTVERPGGTRWDVGCHACGMKLWCIPDPYAAQLWERHHRCSYGGKEAQ